MGAGCTQKTNDFRSAKKPCIKNTSELFRLSGLCKRYWFLGFLAQAPSQKGPRIYPETGELPSGGLKGRQTPEDQLLAQAS